ncbi:MAG TPA: hypothetical protein VKY22_30775 [Bradyrhizobium sp.]|nr:hypothetical protein [Bradyrhizobium sp.]
MLDIPAHDPGLVLKLPAGALEGAVDCESQVGISLILLRRAADMNLPAVGQRQTDAHLVLAARLVMIAGSLDDDTSRRDPTKMRLQFRNMPIDGALHSGRVPDAFEFDLSWRFHDCLHRPGI